MHIKTFAIAVIMSGAMALPAFAQAPNRIKQHNAWGSYSYSSNSGKVCYVLSMPTAKEPKDRDHGDVFFMLAKHPNENVKLEANFVVGYPFRDNSRVVLDIDGKKFNMFTRGNKAWMENPAEEPMVVQAMKAGKSMVVQGESRRGTKTSYTYSLSGVSASISDIQSCK